MSLRLGSTFLVVFDDYMIVFHEEFDQLNGVIFSQFYKKYDSIDEMLCFGVKLFPCKLVRPFLKK